MSSADESDSDLSEISVSLLLGDSFSRQDTAFCMSDGATRSPGDVLDPAVQLDDENIVDIACDLMEASECLADSLQALNKQNPHVSIAYSNQQQRSYLTLPDIQHISSFPDMKPIPATQATDELTDTMVTMVTHVDKQDELADTKLTVANAISRTTSDTDITRGSLSPVNYGNNSGDGGGGATAKNPPSYDEHIARSTSGQAGAAGTAVIKSEGDPESRSQCAMEGYGGLHGNHCVFGSTGDASGTTSWSGQPQGPEHLFGTSGPGYRSPHPGNSLLLYSFCFQLYILLADYQLHVFSGDSYLARF